MARNKKKMTILFILFTFIALITVCCKNKMEIKTQRSWSPMPEYIFPIDFSIRTIKCNVDIEELGPDGKFYAAESPWPRKIPNNRCVIYGCNNMRGYLVCLGIPPEMGSKNFRVGKKCVSYAIEVDFEHPERHPIPSDKITMAMERFFAERAKNVAICN